MLLSRWDFDSWLQLDTLQVVGTEAVTNSVGQFVVCEHETVKD